MKNLLVLLVAILLTGTTAQAQKKNNKASAAALAALEQGQTATDGRRVGKWNFYDYNHKLELTFDYDSSRISFLPPDTARYAMLSGEQWALTAMSRPPRILGSKDHRLMMAGRQIRYPVAALQQQLQGAVVLAYTVGADGHSRDYSVVSGVGGGCTEEVWRVVQQMPDTWIPAIYRGQAVDTRFYLKVIFEIKNSPVNLATAREQAALATDSQPATTAPLPRRPAYVEEVVVTAFGVTRTTTPIRRPQ
jgi:protein TonB